ncbi:MAG: SpoIIE family protein phosphatase [Fibrobacteres bacterium]|nr:SpoIIE family protein phosphatase [Fibrobacterota bacterium]
MKNENFTIEVGHAAIAKTGNSICGDSFHSMRVQGEGRIILALADGLGSGIKASVLSTLTASMASRFAESLRDPSESAELILKTLPVCSVRGMGYSTFTVLTMRPDGVVQIAGHGNPPVIIVRKGKAFIPGCIREPIKSLDGVSIEVERTSFKAEPLDRLVLVTDGVTQAGIGSDGCSCGFAPDVVCAFLETELNERPDITAKELAERVIGKASVIDRGFPGDDTSCVSVHYRRPKKALILTGPPYDKERDEEFAKAALQFTGTKIICGGTTASIVSRELKREIKLDITSLRSGEPPAFGMDGFDLVTEGALSLSRLLDLLESGKPADCSPSGKLQSLILNHDEIHFIVGMSMNAAHHDPTLPVELDIRRNMVKRIGRILQEKFLKEVRIDYV